MSFKIPYLFILFEDTIKLIFGQLKIDM